MEKIGFELPFIWELLDFCACASGDAMGDMELLVCPAAASTEGEFVMSLCSQTLWVGCNFMSGFLLTGDVCDNLNNLRSAHK